MRNKFYKFIFLVSCFLSLTSIANAKLFNAHEFVLDNGLRLIVVENKKAPIIKQMLWYNVGSADEAPFAHGSAHLLEHLMFRGSDFNQLMEKHGVEMNAFTSQDFTSYHEFMDISKLELALYLEAKRMKSLDISKKDFELERDIVWQERKQVVENNPLSVFSETFSRTFWQDNPYARPITGQADEIQELRLQDIKSFYNTYYTPNNATMVLVGDIEPELAYKLVKKYFGDIKSKERPQQKLLSSVSNTNAKFEMRLDKIKTPRFIKSFMAPKNSYALDVFAKYLADGKTSFLYKKMVDKDKSALAVSASYNGLGKYGSSFSISITPVKKFDVDNLLKEALTSFDEKALRQTKQKMLASLVFVKDNPEDTAYIIGQLASSGLGLNEIESYEDNIKNVSLSEVKKQVNALIKNNSLQGELK